jgi:hypothetical protein
LGTIAEWEKGEVDYLFLSWVSYEVFGMVMENFKGWPDSLKLGYVVPLESICLDYWEI